MKKKGGTLTIKKLVKNYRVAKKYGVEIKKVKRQKENWEIEFDEEFLEHEQVNTPMYDLNVERIKDFVSSQKELSYQVGLRDGLRKQHENTESWKDLAIEIRQRTLEDVAGKVEQMGHEYFVTHKELMYVPYNKAITDVLVLLSYLKRNK